MAEGFAAQRARLLARRSDTRQSRNSTSRWPASARIRRLVFRQQTLDRIVAEFNRYNSRQMRLEGAGVASRVFTGVFDADDADSLAQVLARDPSLSVSYLDHVIVVNAR